MKLLSTGNPKILKGLKQGFNTYIMHLAPANLSGYETCPKRTAGCTAACLNTAGRGGMFKKGENTNAIQKARIRKTKMFFENRTEFFTQLVKDIELGIKQSDKKDLVPVFRLNGTSDLSFEKYEVIRNGKLFRNIFSAFPEVQFYDYTKILGRKVSEISNYHLTFSAADGNDIDVTKAVAQGYNVAVVFGIKKTLPMPEDYVGMPVFNGDDNMKFATYRDRDNYDTRHGGPFDRGSADSYYHRGITPHYYVEGTSTSPRIEEVQMTEKEISDYMAGYEWNEQFGDKKSWE